jgi:shikimate kinase
LPHIVERRRRAGAAKGLGGVGPAVAAAMKSKHGDIRGTRGHHAGNAVDENTVAIENDEIEAQDPRF